MSFVTGILRLHYNGKFVSEGSNVVYVSGDIEHLDYDPDYLSYWELVDLCKQKGFDKIKGLHYLTPGMTMKDGLKPIQNDSDAMAMVNVFCDKGSVDVYVEHDVEEVLSLSVVENMASKAFEHVAYTNLETEYLSGSEDEELMDSRASWRKLSITEREKKDADGGDGTKGVDKVGAEVVAEVVDKADQCVDEAAEHVTEAAEHAGEATFPAEPGDQPISGYISDNPPDSDGDFGEIVSDEEDKIDDATRRRGRFAVYQRKKGCCPHIEMGMLFKNNVEFKHAVSLLAIYTNRAIVWAKNTPKKCRAKCATPNCPWVLYGSENKSMDSFQVKTFHDVHECNKVFNNPRMSQAILQELIEDKLIRSPWLKDSEVVEEISHQYGTGVKLSMVRRTKKVVKDNIISNYKEQFAHLNDYGRALRLTNPGTTVIMKLLDQTDKEVLRNSPAKFHRLYVCINALKLGLMEGCRRFLGLDGCFLKTLTKGELLCAVGRDANNQMFPVAWALVEVERTDSWLWFIQLLKEDLTTLGDGAGWTIITDQQKGLKHAISELLPQTDHRFCARHLYVNWMNNGHRSEEMKQAFWSIVKTSRVSSFEDLYRNLRAKNEKAANDLDVLPRKQWARSYFEEDNRIDMVDNNMCEAFNGTLLEARRLSIISLFEEIRVNLMSRIAKKRVECQKWKGSFGPNIWKIIDKNAGVANHCFVRGTNGEKAYEIKSGDEIYVVDLNNRTCTCRRYQLSGIPCAHSICAIREERAPIEDYVSSWYHKDMYKLTYGHAIQPMPGMKDWPKATHEEVVVHSPKMKKMPGLHQQCGICHQKGHNSRRCPQKEGSQMREQPQHPTTATVSASVTGPGSGTASASASASAPAPAPTFASGSASAPTSTSVSVLASASASASTSASASAFASASASASASAVGFGSDFTVVDSEGRVVYSTPEGRSSPILRSKNNPKIKHGAARKPDRQEQQKRKNDVALGTQESQNSLVAGNRNKRQQIWRS